MKKVIDVGALRSSELEKFLLESRSHIAIITDHAFLESCKGGIDTNIRNNFEIVSRYLPQVLVLKQTPQVMRLRPGRTGLLNRLIDPGETKRFHEYCRALAVTPVADFRKEAAFAREHFGNWAKAAGAARLGIAHMRSTYTQDDLKALRKGEPISAAFAQSMVDDIVAVTMSHFRGFDGPVKTPTFAELLYSFQFRYAVCGYALALRWISDGGVESAAQGKIDNDLVDATYAAYATFFDGLITNDKKLRGIHELARSILVQLFEVA